MNNFKVGDYVLYDALGKYMLAKIKTIEKPGTYGIDFYNETVTFSGVTFNALLVFEKDIVRIATVMDYIRTLNAEQIVNNYATVGYHSGCKCCMGYHDGHSCHGEYSCSKHKIQWLNQPLTDDIVKQLGGKE